MERVAPVIVALAGIEERSKAINPRRKLLAVGRSGEEINALTVAELTGRILIKRVVFLRRQRNRLGESGARQRGQKEKSHQRLTLLHRHRKTVSTECLGRKCSAWRSWSVGALTAVTLQPF